MNSNTSAWLEFAKRDYVSAKKLLDDEFLANIVLFHSQQFVEKSLKAIFEELDIEIPKLHNTARLFKLIESITKLNIDLDILNEIDSVYIESRYPASIGLLPSGFPTKLQAQKIFEKSEIVYKMILEYLEADKNHLWFV